VNGDQLDLADLELETKWRRIRDNFIGGFARLLPLYFAAADHLVLFASFRRFR
jgi:hypothetical protein